MRLTFQSTFLSIKDFPEIDLPPFTLITGLNGTGKSHILRAIKEGSIRSDAAPNFKTEVSLQDWLSLIPQDTGTYDSRTWLQQRSNLRDNIQAHARQHGGRIIDTARRSGLPPEHLKDVAYVSNLSIQDLTTILGDEEKAQLAKNQIYQAAETESQNIRNSLGGNEHMLRSMSEILRHANKPLIAIDDQDFFHDGEDRWGSTELFQQSLAQVFSAYRDIALRSALKIRAKERGRAIDIGEAENFISANMTPPWDFVNDAMKTAHLDFEIDHPDLDDYVPYQPRLTKKSTGARIYFSDLSSGERVLMSLALSLYYTTDTRQISKYPKLLLLDEVDAPLHPSMSRFYLDVLINTIGKSKSIPIIATTHSPSTVAMAPEDSIYVIEPGSAGLRKTTKSHALNILTQGVPTLAISFDGRRQVFVESQSDAKIFDSLNQNIKANLKSECSLEFIATGIKNPQNGSSINTGCEVVRHLVKALANAGNKSTLGLIDWDGANNPSDRVYVLAHGSRNGIENSVLDPLALASFIVGYARKHATSIGVSNTTSYLSFLDFDPRDLQPIVNNLQELALERPISRTSSCEYLGGFSLNIDIEYLTMDDHDLEKRILKAFPELKKFSINRPAGSLMLEICQTTLKDKPNFTPMEIYKTFLDLLGAPNH